MNYSVKRIKDKSEITSCMRFDITNFMWDSLCQPKTYGYLGYIEGTGLFAKFFIKETDPKREYTQNRDRVYKDSAVEVFLAFLKDGESLSNDCMYTNFEFNSNGALLANYGVGRKGRQSITDEQFELANCTTTILEDHWTAEVTIPESYLYQICDFDAFKNGKEFYCNFYKIAEDEKIMHFGSYSPIESSTPNFHLPVCFAPAKIEE